MGIWENLGADYPTINKRLRGLPDWLRTIETNVGRPLSAATSKAADVMTSGLATPVIDMFTGGKYSKLQKPIQEEHPEMAKAGEIAGIPLSAAMGGIGRVPALAGKAASLAVPGTKRVVDLAKAGIMAGAGAGQGALESGIRTATGQQEGSLAGNIATGAGLGAAGGAAGSSLSDMVSHFFSNLPKKSAKATLAMADVKKRGMMNLLRRSAGSQSGALKQAAGAGDVAQDVAGVIKKYDLDVEGNLEKVANWQRAKWKDLDSAFEAAVPDTRASSILSGLLSQDEIAELGSKYGSSAQAAADGIMKKAQQVKGLANTREMLKRTIDAGFKQTDEDAGAAMREIAGTLRSRVDDLVGEAAEKAGIDFGPAGSFAGLKHEYGLLQPVAQGVSLEEIAPQAVHLGSPTAEKLGVTGLLQRIAAPTAGSALGAGGGLVSGGDDPKDIAMRVAGGALAGFGVSKGLGRLATKGMSAAAPLARMAAKAAPTVSNLSRAAGIGGAKVAADMSREDPVAIEQQAVSQTAPATPGQETAASTGAAAGTAASTGNTEAYQQKVADVIAKAWAEQGMEAQAPGQLPMVMAYIREQTNGLDPKMTAGVVFSDPDERKKFLDAYEVSQALSANVEKAAGYDEGFAGMFPKKKTKGEQESMASYQQLNELLGDRAEKAGGKGGRSVVEGRLRKILKDKRMTTAGRRRAIEELLTMYGTDMGVLSKAGLA